MLNQSIYNGNFWDVYSTPSREIFTKHSIILSQGKRIKEIYLNMPASSES